MRPYPPPPPGWPAFLSVEEVAARLNLSVKQALSLISAGVLKPLAGEELDALFSRRDVWRVWLGIL